jgi:predicted nuclease of predicted toxin-antitoxin system
MKLLLDQGLPRSSAELLRRAGVDAVHVGELGLSAAEDASILQSGREQDRVVVTLDADFHSLLASSAASSPSVIRFRIEGLGGEALLALLQTVLTQCSAELEQGAAVTVQVGRIRIRHLPLIPG